MIYKHTEEQSVGWRVSRVHVFQWAAPRGSAIEGQQARELNWFGVFLPAHAAANSYRTVREKLAS